MSLYDIIGVGTFVVGVILFSLPLVTRDAQQRLNGLRFLIGGVIVYVYPFIIAAAGLK